jgi:hypothetical protein
MIKPKSSLKPKYIPNRWSKKYQESTLSKDIINNINFYFQELLKLILVNVKGWQNYDS